MKEKSSAKQKISLPLNLFITLLYVIGYFFVAFIFLHILYNNEVNIFLGKRILSKGCSNFLHV